MHIAPATSSVPAPQWLDWLYVCISKRRGMQVPAKGGEGGGGVGARGGGRPEDIRGGLAGAAQVCQVGAPALRSQCIKHAKEDVHSHGTTSAGQRCCRRTRRRLVRRAGSSWSRRSSCPEIPYPNPVSSAAQEGCGCGCRGCAGCAR